MNNQQFEISFEDCLPGDAAGFAQALGADIREFAPAVAVELKKERMDSQDFGTTLVVLFGTPVAITLARAVGAFLQRHSGASIKISKSGEVIARNLDSSDAARIAEAFAGKHLS
jgi:hypothetical protein